MKIDRILEQIISIPFYFLIIPIPVLMIHWSMTKEDSNVKRLKRATYKDFKERFLKEEWETDKYFPSSLFSTNGYIHASIIRFDDVGYLLTAYGYFRAYFLVSKVAKELNEVNRKPYI